MIDAKKRLIALGILDTDGEISNRFCEIIKRVHKACYGPNFCNRCYWKAHGACSEFTKEGEVYAIISPESGI